MLSELIALLSPILPTETSVFKGEKEDKYAVLTPMMDRFQLYVNDSPGFYVEEVKVSLFIQGNYLETKNQIINLLLKSGFDITEMKYVGLEDDTGYHHYSINTEKTYERTEEI